MADPVDGAPAPDTAPAAQTVHPISEPTIPATPPADPAPAAAATSLADQVEAIHAKHAVGSRLANDTESWNLVRRMVDEIKSLIAKAEAKISQVEKDL